MSSLKLKSILAAASVLAVLAAPAGAAEFTLKLSSVAVDGSTFDEAQKRFKSEVERLTNGRAEIVIYNNGSLANNRESFELAKTGAIEMVFSGISHATRYAPVLNTTLLPYIWKDGPTMFAVLDSDIGKKLGDALEAAQGVRILGWWDNGFRSVSNNQRPIVKADDIKGLKLRTLPSAVHVTFFRELGAVPTPMGWSEVIPALQSGVIDGQENPPAVMLPYRVYEVQKFYSLTNHVNEPMVLAISTATANKLPKDVLTAVEQAARTATLYQREINARDTDGMLAKLKELMKVNDVPAETMAQFRKVAISVYASAAKDMGGDAGQAIANEIVKRNE